MRHLYWLASLLLRRRVELPGPFRDRVVEADVERLKACITDPKFARMLEKCALSTLHHMITLVWTNGQLRTVVRTGDIHATWLRDTSPEIRPFLDYADKSPWLRHMFAGVIRLQGEQIRHDPYANSFLLYPGQKSPHSADHVSWSMHGRQFTGDGVWECKWELDSYSYALGLAYDYWQLIGDATPLQDGWHDTARLILDVCREQQHFPNSYSYQRPDQAPVPNGGQGATSQYCGMVRTAFRPSDDIVTYPFHIADNLALVVALRQLAEMAEQIWHDYEMARQCRELRAEVLAAVKTHGIMVHPEFGQIFAYEVDGMGGVNFMDDANVPSLMALPHTVPELLEDPDMQDTYNRTRQFVLSQHNPYYFEGIAACGIGSPHTEHEGEMIWPMSLIIRILTSEDTDEIRQNLRWLLTTDADKDRMHESFDKNDPHHFTREEFGWPDELFFAMVKKLAAKYPHLLHEMYAV